MERRKFMIGAGALATGSAAAVGTGAFSSAEVERTVSVEVAGDQNAWIELNPESDYAEINSDDALELDFTDHPNEAGWNGREEGINPDATYTFSDVFSIWMDQAAAHGNYDYYIEKSGFDGVDVTIEAGAQTESHIMEEGTDLTNWWGTLDGGPHSISVDITLESEEGAGSANGSLTIHAEEV